MIYNYKITDVQSGYHTSTNNDIEGIIRAKCEPNP